MPPVPDAPLLFLDYDGTLAPIVDDPSAAVPHPDVPDLLDALDARYPVWIVTGRDVRALEAFLDRSLPVIGLHGSQEGRLGGEVRRLMSDDALNAIRELRERVPDTDGVEVEEKDPSFAVHYRKAADDAVDALEAWVDTMPDVLDAVWGKNVVEVRPKGLTKGSAVRRIAVKHPDRTPVYLGDDVTDEDAFKALHALRDATGRAVVTVKVGPEDTAAEHRLDTPDDVVRYLQRFLSS